MKPIVGISGITAATTLMVRSPGCAYDPSKDLKTAENDRRRAGQSARERQLDRCQLCRRTRKTVSEGQANVSDAEKRLADAEREARHRPKETSRVRRRARSISSTRRHRISR